MLQRAACPVFFTAAGGGADVNWEDDVWPGCYGQPAHAYYWPITAFGDNFGYLSGNMHWELTGAATGMY